MQYQHDHCDEAMQGKLPELLGLQCWKEISEGKIKLQLLIDGTFRTKHRRRKFLQQADKTFSCSSEARFDRLGRTGFEGLEAPCSIIVDEYATVLSAWVQKFGQCPTFRHAEDGDTSRGLYASHGNASCSRRDFGTRICRVSQSISPAGRCEGALLSSRRGLRRAMIR
jgi:hypothetical protein